MSRNTHDELMNSLDEKATEIIKTMPVFAEKYFNNMDDRNLSKRTKLQYAYDMKQFFDFFIIYYKQQKKVAKIHRHIANQRKDYLHKESTAIAKQYDYVCVESLNMRAMSNKGFGNGKATLDNGNGMFLVMLDYKLQEKGGGLIKVDKFYPSSQLCNCCGFRNPLLKDLTIRKWVCPNCDTYHDRDENAAQNIKHEGL